MRKFAIPFVLLFLCSLGVSANVPPAASIAALDVAIIESFDSLPSSGSSATTPDGWTFSESGSSGANNGLIAAGTGSSNAGDTYSFGTASDRAFGQLRSGTLISIIGGAFKNNTGATINSLAISYAGEQWRFGGAHSPNAERMDFQYSTDAGSLGTGTWLDVNALDFTPTVTSGTAGALNGNANAIQISSTITGLSIAPGATFYIRWTDVDASGSDDGLAIDDFSLIASGPDPAPRVASTAPAKNATSVPIASTITINFNESVNAAADAFSITCNGASQPFTPTSGPASAFTLTPEQNLPSSAHCVVVVIAANVTDSDGIDPPNTMVTDFTFAFDTGLPADTAPSVVSTVPTNGTVDVNPAASIVVNFSEQVTATLSAFEVNCGAGNVAFGQTSGVSASFTIDPNVDLPGGASCTVTVRANQISDLDINDPPDHPLSDYVWSFTTAVPVATNVLINEIDADTPGSPQDLAEFVELYDGGVGNTSLNGLAVVFYDGNTDASYAAFDLDNFHTNAQGYFILGNPGVSGVDIEFGPGEFGFLQNGADAVALVMGNASSFPPGTPVGTANVLDAVVYDTGDPDDGQLLPLLNANQPQVNESGGDDSPNQSIGRCGNGLGGARNTLTYHVGAPTPDGPNQCPPPPSDSPIVISQLYGGGGNGGATYQNDYVELFNRSNAVVDITGWTLQYASAAGSGWDFNKTPLGGPIAPGEYYLVKLATNGAVGQALPAANVSGPINMSGTTGKIALVASVATLTGECPIGHPDLRDFVGYGNSANCAEGNTRAPAPSVTAADFRLNGGATDTQRNFEDFATGAPNPRRTAPIVELPPFLLSADPSTNGRDVPRDPTIVLTFTEPVTVVNPWFEIICASTGHHDGSDDYTLAGNGTIYDITLNQELLAGESCTIAVFKDQVHDVDTDDAGNTDTLPANYSWSFTVASGNAPPFPSSVHLTFGNPSHAVNDVNQFNNYLMEKAEYALSYNRDQGRPNWVSWHLSSEWYGNLARNDTFRADPKVLPDWYRVQGFDFSGSGFDRGHMVPNADRDNQNAIPINQATYLMTNMVAQAPDNNQGPWAAFEGALRTIADGGNELYIVAGPYGSGGTGSSGDAITIANGHVTVPDSTWKVALVLPKADGDDISRVTCSTRSIAVIMPNVQGIRNDDWHKYLVSVDDVENLIGYDLFSNLAPAVEYCVEADIDGETQVEEDLTPPAIECDTPDGAWHADNVTLTCTATDSESGLNNSGDASFTLVTLVPDGTFNSNAATDVRVICDAVGNCAAAGPIAGNMIDRKDPVASMTTPADGAVYTLDAVVNASFECSDDGSGLASCAGTNANGTAIDTASSGPKIFSLTAIDSVGNAATVAVTYTVSTGPSHKRTPSISIANIPSTAVNGGSFTPTHTYDGDGVIHLQSLTPAVCKVKADSIVNFIGAGTCTLVASATPTGSVNAARGPAQSFVVLP